MNVDKGDPYDGKFSKCGRTDVRSELTIRIEWETRSLRGQKGKR